MSEDLRLRFWRKWYKSDFPHKELDKTITKRVIEIARAMSGKKKLMIHSISTMLNAYFEDIVELAEKIKECE